MSPTISDVAHFVYFMGGADLEMSEIRGLINRAGLGNRVVDDGLSWGAAASVYRPEIERTIAAGGRPVLVELADDLGPVSGRECIVFVDHHGSRAGWNAPSALRQIYDLLPAEVRGPWTRRMALVEANDVGHIAGLREAGASDAEIRQIRDADRASQGVSAESERRAKALLRSGLKRVGRLTEVEADASVTSALTDFLDPAYGGPGSRDLLVIRPDGLSFFGDGRVINALRNTEGCWYGGALPITGYWGINAPPEAVRHIQKSIEDLLI